MIGKRLTAGLTALLMVYSGIFQNAALAASAEWSAEEAAPEMVSDMAENIRETASDMEGNILAEASGSEQDILITDVDESAFEQQESSDEPVTAGADVMIDLPEAEFPEIDADSPEPEIMDIEEDLLSLPDGETDVPATESLTDGETDVPAAENLTDGSPDLLTAESLIDEESDLPVGESLPDESIVLLKDRDVKDSETEISAGEELLPEEETEEENSALITEALDVADNAGVIVTRTDSVTGITGTLTDTVLTIRGNGDMSNYSISDSSYQNPWWNYKDQITEVKIEEGITGIGNCAFYTFSRIETVHLPSSLKEIGNYAFSGCAALNNIQLPESLQRVGSSAFAGTSLTQVTIPSSVTVVSVSAFENCKKLEEVSVNGSVSTISSYTFYNCPLLRRVSLPDTVQIIDASAFQSCSALTDIRLPSSLKTIGKNAFIYCSALQELEVPETVTTVGKTAFYGCDALQRLTVLSKDAVYDLSGSTSPVGACSSLEKIYGFASGTTKAVADTKQIPFIAFDDTANYQVIIMAAKDSVREDTQEQVFFDGTELVSGKDYEVWVSVEAFADPPKVSFSVKGFGRYAALSDITEYTYVDQSLIAEGVFDNGISWKLKTDGTLLLEGSGSLPGYAYTNVQTASPLWEYREQVLRVEVGSGITKIGNYFFYDYKNLREVQLPDTLNEIGLNSFYYCSSLQTIDLPKSLKIIGSQAFEDSGLIRITIPETVTSLGVHVFNSCLSLIEADILAPLDTLPRSLFIHCQKMERVSIPDTVTKLEGGVFSDCQSLKQIELPQGLKEFGGSDFNGCRSLESLDLSHVSVMGILELGSCSSLTSVTLSSELKEIPEYCFYQNSKLKSVTLPAGLTAIGKDAFKYSGIASLEVPSSVVSVGETAFSSCSSLKEIAFLNRDVQISGNAFIGCSVLGKVYGYENGESNASDLAGSLSVPFVAYDNPSSYDVTLSDTQFVSDGTRKTPGVSVTFDGKTLAEGADYSVAYSNCVQPGTASAVVTGLGRYEGISLTETYTISSAEESLIKTGSCGENVTWELSNGELTIRGSGSTYSYLSYPYAPWYSLRGSIRSVRIISGVSGIGDGLFFDCRALTDVSIASTVTSIGGYAFKSCQALRSVTLPGSLRSIGSYAFYDSGLTSVSIPRSVNYLGEGAFASCSQLSSATVSAQMDRLEMYVFNDCPALLSVTLPSGLKEIGTAAFDSCTLLGSIALPPALELVEESAFGSCSSLKKIVLPDTVEELGEGAFAACSSLTDVTLPKNLKNIPARTFAECTSLRSISLPDGLLSLGLHAFRAAGLITVTLPESVTSVGALAFADCAGLSEITILSETASCGQTPFAGCGALKAILGRSGSGAESAAKEQGIPFGALDDGSNLTCVLSEDDCYYDGKAKTPAVSVRFTFGGIDRALTETDDYTLSYENNVLPGQGNVVISGSGIYTGAQKKVPFSIRVSEDSLSEGALTEKAFWSLKSDGTLSIQGQGTTPDYAVVSGKPAPWASMAGQIRRIEVGEGIIGLGNDLFYGLSGVTDVTLPESLTVIGMSVFYRCTSLAGISIPDAVTAIGAHSFFECTALSQVFLGSGITMLSVSLFEGCTNLQQIRLPEQLRTIGIRAFYGSGLKNVEIPENVNAIASAAFGECRNLKMVDMPGHVEETQGYAMGTGIFHQASGLTVYTWKSDLASSIGEGDDVRVVPYYETGNYSAKLSGNRFAYTGEEICPKVTVYFDGRILQEGTDYTLSYSKNIQPGTFASANIRPMGKYRTFTMSYQFTIYEENQGNLSGNLTETATWKLLENNTVLVISGTGYTMDYPGGQDIPWKEWAGQIQAVQVDEGITGLGNYMLSGLTALTEADLPDTLTSIGMCTFAGCSKLEQIDLPEGLRQISTLAFRGCSALKKVIVPSSVNLIWIGAFAGCTALEQVQLSELSVLPEEIFLGCISLKQISLPETISSIGARAFSGSGLTSIELPAAVSSVAKGAFGSCSALEEVTFLNRLVSAETGVFTGSNSLKTIYGYSGSGAETAAQECGAEFAAFDDESQYTLRLLDEKMTYTGQPLYPRAQVLFHEKLLQQGRDYGYSAASNIYPGSGSVTVTGYGRYDTLRKQAAFRILAAGSVDGGMLGETIYWYLTEDDVLVIAGTGDMPGCSWELSDYAWSAYKNQILGIRVEEGITGIGEDAFLGLSRAQKASLPQTLTHIDAGAFRELGQLSSVEIPAGVTTIGASAFAGSALQSIILPEKVTSIGKRVFSGCSSLTDAVISARISSLPEGTFENCGALENIQLPESLTMIGAAAFAGCASLQKIALPSKMTVLSDEAFRESALTEIELPEGVAALRAHTFENCSSLTCIRLLGRNINVQENALQGAAALEKVYGYSTSNAAVAAENAGAQFVAYDDPQQYQVLSDKTKVLYKGADTEKPKVSLQFDTMQLTPEKDYTVSYVNADLVGTATAVVQGLARYAGVELRMKYAVERPDDVTASGKCGPSVTWTLQADGLLLLSGTGNTYPYEDSAYLPWASYLTQITGVQVSKGIVSIGKGLFRNCTAVRKVTLPATLTSIGESAFRGDTALTAITLPSGIGRLGDYAFAGCSALKQASISGTKIQDLPAGGFQGCAALTNISFPASLLTIQSGCFEKTSLASLELPKTIGNVKSRAFADIQTLKKITVLSADTVIASDAFSGCKAVQKLYGFDGTTAHTAAKNLRAANGKTVFVAFDKAASYAVTLTLPKGGYTYDGKAKKPSVKVTFDGAVLAGGTNYSVSYAKNTAAGTASVIVTGKGRYCKADGSGMKLTKTFKIAPKSLKGTMLALSKMSFVYTGKAIKPGVKKATLGSKTLKSGTDFTVSYKNRKTNKAVNPKDVGEYVLIIKGKGNYSSATTASITFKITKADPALKVPASYTLAAGASAFKLGVTCKNKSLKYASNNKKVAPVSTAGKVTPKALGKAVITITSPATKNYKAATKKVTITVGPKAPSLTKVTSPAKRKIALKWTKVAASQGYQISLSASSTFAKNWANQNNRNSVTSMSFTVPNGLASGKTAYVRIRSWKKVGSTVYYGPWSAKKSVKIK